MHTFGFGFGLDLVNHVEMFVPSRLGMLTEEPVPHADTMLEALAKHLEVKLSYGKLWTSTFHLKHYLFGNEG